VHNVIITVLTGLHNMSYYFIMVLDFCTVLQ